MEFDPIILRYDGLATDGRLIDLGQLGQSLQGAAQLIGTAATIVTTGQYAKSVLAVRIYAGIPRDGSWELPAIITKVVPALSGQFPIFAELSKVAATKAATAIVNTSVKIFSRQAAKKGETEMALDFAEKALAEAGQTQRHAMDAVVRMAEMQRNSARLLVVPVGLSCETLRVGDVANGAFAIDRETRAAIDAPEEIEIQTSARHEILISEMDRVNSSCKFALREDLDTRLPGVITDPIIQSANDPYSLAFSAQRWVTVIGKLQLRQGEPDRLFISDIVPD